MTSVDIPERLEWRCMLPVKFLGHVADKIECIVLYNSTGLNIAKEIVAAGVRHMVDGKAIRRWFHQTEDHYVEFVGGLHGRGNFYGYDRETKEIRSFLHDMKDLGYATEDDE